MIRWLGKKFGLIEEDILSCNLDDISRSEVDSGNQWNWIYYYHPYYSFYSHKITGKWVYHADPVELAEIALRIRTEIARGLSPVIKYKPVLNDPSGPFAHLLPPLCVYAIAETRNELGKVLTKKVGSVYWQSNEDTRALHQRLQGEGKTNY